jgi:hypothetical protein
MHKTGFHREEVSDSTVATSTGTGKIELSILALFIAVCDMIT